jgi:hypothetical protein
MGEVADMMVNGFLCEACGELIDGEEPGFPRYCSPRCAVDRGAYSVGSKPGVQPPNPKGRRRG